MEILADQPVENRTEISGNWKPGSFALRDAWFPVAHSPTLKKQPLIRCVHSQPYYLWRDDGRVRANNSHPAALTRAPRTEFVGESGDYPVIEKYGHVWVWYGDPAHADPAVLPEIPFLPANRAQPRYSWGVSFFHTAYELVLENILDMTHIDFVHANYAGHAESEEDIVTFEATSETVTMTRKVRKRPTSKYQRDVLGITAKYQDQVQFTHIFIRSGVCFLHSHYSAAPAIPLMQSNTPESTVLTRANFVFGIQQTKDRNYARTWPSTAPFVAAQDERVLRPQSPRYIGQPVRQDSSTRFDAACLHYRRRHEALVKRQLQGDFAYQGDYAEGSDLAEILKIKRLS